MLAQLPKPECLRLTHAPWMKGDPSAAKRRRRHAQVADEIMAIFGASGASMHTLKLLPVFRPDDDLSDGARDESGHVWPDYVYRRGAVSLVGDDSKQVLRTVAVPCQEGTWPDPRG